MKTDIIEKEYFTPPRKTIWQPLPTTPEQQTRYTLLDILATKDGWGYIPCYDLVHLLLL